MKKISLIHDLSGFGKCSLTAAIPVISVMGIQACPLPTAILSSQTGFDSFYIDDYTDKMDTITNEWSKITNNFDGIYSGFLASPLQIEKVLTFISTFNTEGTVILVDPVMGDNAKTIKSFSKELLQGMQQLVSKSTVTTPNLTELCLLTDTSYDSVIQLSHDKEAYLSMVTSLSKQLFKSNTILNPLLRSQTIITTGLHRTQNNQQLIGNLAVTLDKGNEVVSSYYVESAYTGKSFSGTGDLFASIICGGLVKGIEIEDCMKLAVDFLSPAIKEATEENIEKMHGVSFEKYLSMLL